MCTQTTVSRSGRCSRHQLHSSGVLWRPLVSTVSFSAVARLLAREQLPRHLLHENLLLAPQRKRSGAPDLVCEANMKHTVWVKRVRFFCVPAVSPSVHARSARMGTGEHESERDTDRGQQLVVRGLLRSPSPRPHNEPHCSVLSPRTNNEHPSFLHALVHSTRHGQLVPAKLPPPLMGAAHKRPAVGMP